MKNDADQSDRLEDALRQARAAARPSDALMARVLADAASVQAAIRSERERATDVPRQRFSPFRSFIDLLGGWPAASGVALAGVAGLSLGFLAPEVVDVVSSGQLWYLAGDASATPDLGNLWLEDGDV